MSPRFSCATGQSGAVTDRIRARCARPRTHPSARRARRDCCTAPAIPDSRRSVPRTSRRRVGLPLLGLHDAFEKARLRLARPLREQDVELVIRVGVLPVADQRGSLLRSDILLSRFRQVAPILSQRGAVARQGEQEKGSEASGTARRTAESDAHPAGRKGRHLQAGPAAFRRDARPWRRSAGARSIRRAAASGRRRSETIALRQFRSRRAGLHRPRIRR